MNRFTALLVAAASACASAPVVRPGVEVFVEHPPALVRGKRVGLITNQSGIDRQRRSTINLLGGMPDLRLVALYSPEHGIRGVAETRVASSVDEKTGLPIHSLYGDADKPTPQMLEGIDVLIYDIQDLGVRQYTFESTLALAMQAAAEKGIPIVVLDRPNPVTGTILEGNILEPAYQSFVGIYPVLSRHGMTLGELARMYNAEQRIGADLTVVPIEGWRRDMWWDETGLPWVNPSPNIRRLEADPLPRYGVLRGDEPVGGAWHGSTVRADRCALAQEHPGHGGHERDEPAGHPARSSRVSDGGNGAEVSRPGAEGRALHADRPRILPAARHVAADDRPHPPPPAGSVPVGGRDRRAPRWQRAAAAGDRGRNAARAAARVGARSGDVPSKAGPLPDLPVNMVLRGSVTATAALALGLRSPSPEGRGGQGVRTESRGGQGVRVDTLW